MSDTDIFRDEFLPNIEAATITFAQWRKQQPNEYKAWITYKNAVLAGGLPEPPTPKSRFGKALMAVGHMAERNDMRVTVTVPTTAPLAGTVTVTATASPPTQAPTVTRVDFFVDNVLKGSDTSSPYTYAWDTTLVMDGQHTVTAKAFYPRNKFVVDEIDVQVKNTVGPPQPPPIDDPPVNTALPTISGTATQGQTLTVSNGTWTNSPTSYTRQWMRCDAAGANGVAIPGATSSSYALVSADVGGTIRCVVIAYNAVGPSAAAQTAQTGVVAALAPAVPVNVTPPVISGSPVVGNALVASNGSWTNSPTSYTRQWVRGASNISGATGVSYTVVTADVGSTITVKTTAVNASGSSAVITSTPTAVVTAPSPPPSGTPIPSNGIISAGGTYSGSYTGTVRVQTTAPVTITNATITNTTGGTLIDAESGGTVDVTLDHVTAVGGSTYQTSGRFFTAFDFKRVVIRNCTIQYTRGIELTWGIAGSSVVVTKNRHINIQGNDSTTGGDVAGGFIQLREVQNATVDISWNEILNEYNKSHPTDIISLFKSANCKVHDNFIRHNSKPGNAYNTSSQGTITMDQPDGIPPHPHDNEIYNNQLVDTLNGVLVPAYAYNNFIHHNRIIQDGKLPNGTQMGNGYDCMAILNTAGANNHMHDNVIGWVGRDGTRMDWSDQLKAGSPHTRAQEIALNTTLPDPITAQMELDEWTIWQQKLAANGISVGA